MKTKPTVTIGIPAYNAENNIQTLLSSLTNQITKGFYIDSILVYSDCSNDKTLEIVKNACRKNNKIKIINGKKRKGFPAVFKCLARLNRSDVFVLLNDDILILDSHFLNKIIDPFKDKSNIGLLTGNPQPINPNNFIESAGVSTFRAYEKVRYVYKNGQNKFTCDAKILALTEKFISVLKFPHDDKKMGNVDSFLYFSCKLYGLSYRHVRNAVVYFSFPNTLSEYIQWNIRNNKNQHILREYFGEIVRKECTLPKKHYYSALISQFVKAPIKCAFIYLIGLYCKAKAKNEFRKFNPIWNVIQSTKRKFDLERI